MSHFVIHKYPLTIMVGHQFIDMPTGAQILTVQTQRGFPCIWAVHEDPTEETEAREFVIYATGERFHVLGTHIGTVQTFDGEFVWHVFEVTD